MFFWKNVLCFSLCLISLWPLINTWSIEVHKHASGTGCIQGLNQIPRDESFSCCVNRPPGKQLSGRILSKFTTSKRSHSRSTWTSTSPSHFKKRLKKDYFTAPSSTLTTFMRSEGTNHNTITFHHFDRERIITRPFPTGGPVKHNKTYSSRRRQPAMSDGEDDFATQK